MHNVEFLDIYEKARSYIKANSMEKRVQFITNKILKEDKTGDLADVCVKHDVTIVLYVLMCMDSFELSIIKTIFKLYRT